VIGINSMIYGMGTGIGFAIPINLAKELVPQLIAKGSVTRGWLGVAIQQVTPELAKSFGLDENKGGALIADVYPHSPAMEGGMKSGDIVVEFNGKPIQEPFDLSLEVAHTEVDKKVKMKILREGKEDTLTVKIGKREEEKTAQAPVTPETKADLLGLSVRDLRIDEVKESGLKPGEGVLIERVEPDSGAEMADVRAGDILIEINGVRVMGTEAYRKLVADLKKGSFVRLLNKRGSASVFVAFRL